MLLVKLMGDPDHNLRDFQWTTILLVVGAALYFIPYLLGVQGSAVASGQMQGIGNFLLPIRIQTGQFLWHMFRLPVLPSLVWSPRRIRSKQVDDLRALKPRQ